MMPKRPLYVSENNGLIERSNSSQRLFAMKQKNKFTSPRALVR